MMIKFGCYASIFQHKVSQNLHVLFVSWKNDSRIALKKLLWNNYSCLVFCENISCKNLRWFLGNILCFWRKMSLKVFSSLCGKSSPKIQNTNNYSQIVFSKLFWKSSPITKMACIKFYLFDTTKACAPKIMLECIVN